ncbi:AraC family transcriptional regulator [Vallitalea okinawensis]|uniref:AraC family transcriptional regulator n=1 Tax=Vallitalea okinawensis TaxID=2078660 RepID=UPI000CFBC6D9|nr:AraC family transcriptional regulator [Vallitalea okinawensis]
MHRNETVSICSRESINLSLNLYNCGYEEYQANQKWGPKVIDHYLLCYIFEGQGILEVNHVKYPIRKGQGFLISPNTLSLFKADRKYTLKLSSVGFFGYKVEEYLFRANLFPENPIFTYDKDNYLKKEFEQLNELSYRGNNRYCKMMSNLYAIMARLIDISDCSVKKTSKSELSDYYVRKALEFIDMNYSRKLTISDIADFIGLDRKYFHYIFRKKLHLSPQEYIINYKMNKSVHLMKNKYLTISDIARSVGYEDQFHFSKLFKKSKGLSPSEYRKSIEIQNENDF